MVLLGPGPFFVKNNSYYIYLDILESLLHIAFPKEKESIAPHLRAILLLLLFVPQGQKRIAPRLKKKT